MLRFLLRLGAIAGLFNMPTAAAVAEKWARRGAAAGQDFVDGVNNVSESPTEAAARKADKWLAGVQDAAQNRRFEAGLRRVSLEEWKQRTAEVGGARFAQGVQAAQAKMQRAMERVLPMVEATVREVRQMPDQTLEQRVQRSSAFQLGLARRARTTG